jgi:hypothetical protein
MTAVVSVRGSQHHLDFVGLLAVARGNFLEMPGLHLTKKQAQRLWALDSGTCEAVLGALEAAEFLRRTQDGAYLLARAHV